VIARYRRRRLGLLRLRALHGQCRWVDGRDAYTFFIWTGETTWHAEPLTPVEPVWRA